VSWARRPPTPAPRKSSKSPATARPSRRPPPCATSAPRRPWWSWTGVLLVWIVGIASAG